MCQRTCLAIVSGSALAKEPPYQPCTFFPKAAQQIARELQKVFVEKMGAWIGRGIPAPFPLSALFFQIRCGLVLPLKLLEAAGTDKSTHFLRRQERRLFRCPCPGQRIVGRPRGTRHDVMEGQTTARLQDAGRFPIKPRLVWNVHRRMLRPDRSEEHRLNSSHVKISYAVFCLKKKK